MSNLGLTDTAGAASATTLTISGATLTPGSNQATGSTANTLIDNYATATGTYTVTIGGLAASSAYQLELYANNGYFGVAPSATDPAALFGLFTVTTGTTAGGVKNTSSTSLATSNGYNRAQNYVKYTAGNGATITSSAAGVIAFTVSVPVFTAPTPTATSSAFNGFQLSGAINTPEPATLGAIGAASIGLVRRRRPR